MDWIQIRPQGAGPRGSKGVGEPPQVPTAGAIANAISKVLGTQVRQLPMTPERVWAATREVDGVTRSFTSATTLEEAVAALGAGARPVAGGTDLVVGARQGKAPLPEAIVAIDRIEALGGIRRGRRRAASRRPRDARGRSWRARSSASRFTALADASAIVGSHATRATARSAATS